MLFKNQALTITAKLASTDTTTDFTEIVLSVEYWSPSNTTPGTPTGTIADGSITRVSASEISFSIAMNTLNKADLNLPWRFQIVKTASGVRSRPMLLTINELGGLTPV